MSDWLFVCRERNGKFSWWLKLSSETEVLVFFSENNCFDHDKNHYKKVDGWSHDDRTTMTHTEFGGVAQHFSRFYDCSIDDAYALLGVRQLETMLRMLHDTGAVYVNRNMGVNGESSGFKTIGFVRKETLEFPRYYDTDIQIKRFDDGKHYYAYIGDTQVRDGDVLKWTTYEEAYRQAQKYSSTRRVNKCS